MLKQFSLVFSNSRGRYWTTNYFSVHIFCRMICSQLDFDFELYFLEKILSLTILVRSLFPKICFTTKKVFYKIWKLMYFHHANTSFDILLKCLRVKHSLTQTLSILYVIRTGWCSKACFFILSQTRMALSVCYLLAVWPSASYFSFLIFIYLICRMRIKILCLL